MEFNNNNFNSHYQNAKKFQNRNEFNFNNKTNLGKEYQENINYLNNNNNINENDLFSISKDNFFKTSGTFFKKDFFVLNDKINETLNKENNQTNCFKLSNFSTLDKNKKSKSEIDIKYNFYLSNLNKEINKETNNYDNNNFIKGNEQIQKLLEEEKNIEDENLRRLSELRIKYLSSIKTFDMPNEKNLNFYNNNKNNEISNRNNNLEIKAKTERNFISHTMNEFDNNNPNMSSTPFSMCSKLSKQNNSLNDILNSPNDLDNNQNLPSFQRDKIPSQNNYSNYISNILPQKEENDNIMIKSKYVIDYNINKNKELNKICSISNISQNEKKDEINYEISKSEKETLNFENSENFMKEKNLNDNLKKSNHLNENNNNSMDNKIIVKSPIINMSIFERGKEKNMEHLYNTEKNKKINNDIYDKNDEKNKIREKKDSSEYIKSQKYYNMLRNNGINNLNENIDDYELFKQSNFEDSNLNSNEINKDSVNQDIKEKEFNNKPNQQLNNSKSDNNKENINKLLENYKSLEYKYNRLQYEYDSLKDEYMKLLDNNKENNERNVKDEKALFNEYIIKENNDLREINSNYEYIITPLINYINDINCYINKKYLKKIDVARIKQNIRNTNNKKNNNFSDEENSLYPFIQLLQNYKNIIMNNEITNTLNNRSKSNSKLNTYESIMKHYNLKNISFKKSKNNSKDKYSKSISVTPIQSKLGKNHKIFGGPGAGAKTEKYNHKSKGKIQEKRKQIIGRLLKNDSSTKKKYKK